MASQITFRGVGGDGLYALSEIAINGVAVVPEPGGYAMMLAGLVLMGGVVARRRSRNQTWRGENASTTTARRAAFFWQVTFDLPLRPTLPASVSLFPDAPQRSWRRKSGGQKLDERAHVGRLHARGHHRLSVKSRFANFLMAGTFDIKPQINSRRADRRRPDGHDAGSLSAGADRPVPAARLAHP